MYSAKDLKQHAQDLTVLYVEDDDHLRIETSKLFELFFKKIDLAENGRIGLDQYSHNEYDLVLTDINMPEMNGIEMMQKIKEINPEQKIMAISAHNEPDILINLIKAGVDGFVLKPVIHQEVINNLYSVCRDTAAQKLNLVLMEELQQQKEQLEKQNSELQRQVNTIDTKHNQVEKLLATCVEKNVDGVDKDAYFAKDEDEGAENVLLFSDHCVDLTEIFEEIPQIISDYSMHPDPQAILKISDYLTKASAILYHYTPYLDSLCSSMSELATKMHDDVDTVKEIFASDMDSVLMLFDAVSSDMERYVKRFQTESLAMKNSHHIHEPTALSIRQIITILSPSDDDAGGIDFF